MLGGDRQRLEVVPLVFDLGAVDALKAEPAHDLLHPADCPRDRVKVAEPDRLPRQGHVHRLGADGIPAGEPRLGRVEQGCHRGLGLVEESAGSGLVGGVDATKEFLGGLQPTALGTGKLDAGGLERGCIHGPRKCRRCVTLQVVERGPERVERGASHERHATAAGSGRPSPSRTAATTASKPVGSRIAISESVRRSSSQPILTRPAISWL